jgi:hypothetical protein
MGDDLLLDEASSIEEMLKIISNGRWYLLVWYLKKLIKE